jgi:hypothetical protein
VDEASGDAVSATEAAGDPFEPLVIELDFSVDEPIDLDEFVDAIQPIAAQWGLRVRRFGRKEVMREALNEEKAWVGECERTLGLG